MKDPNILACVSLPSVQKPLTGCSDYWDSFYPYFHLHINIRLEHSENFSPLTWRSDELDPVLILEIWHNKMLLCDFDNGGRWVLISSLNFLPHLLVFFPSALSWWWGSDEQSSLAELHSATDTMRIHASTLRKVFTLTLRRLMSYIYIYIWSTHSWCF